MFKKPWSFFIPAVRKICNPTIFPQTTSLNSSERRVHATMYVWVEKFTKESNFFTFQPCFTFYNVAKSLISFPSKLGPERVIPYISSFVLEKAYLFCNKVLQSRKMNINSHTFFNIFTAPMILWLHVSTSILVPMLIFTHHYETVWKTHCFIATFRNH